ncbi:siderophore-interacting protein [uncultured Paraglaciecola sp.]|uniref:siderophore-interacting protein n=1 Tax=uncultured Paraglaciecola sp. TaxID=1765024 RepID=UPI0030DCFF9D|tara:strand:- start:50570 stop:51295 length:726 start_codon:yes stop_codon:yes gene_type:complete
MGPTMRLTEVLSVSDISPHMRRIILTGDSLSDFPENKESAHVKVIFPNPNSDNKEPKLGMYLGFKKWMRSYTIRAFDKQNLALTIDFAVNDHQGLAANWALGAKAGDYLGIAGPGDTKHPDLFADNHLFLGDITALPAIAATLERLPKNAVGHAYIQVPDKQDIQCFTAPQGVEIHWLVTPNKLTDNFLKGLEAYGSELSDTAIFIAVEASVVKQLKSHLNTNCRYDKSKLYASAYWNQKR